MVAHASQSNTHGYTLVHCSETLHTHSRQNCLILHHFTLWGSAVVQSVSVISTVMRVFTNLLEQRLSEESAPLSYRRKGLPIVSAQRPMRQHTRTFYGKPKHPARPVHHLGRGKHQVRGSDAGIELHARIVRSKERVVTTVDGTQGAPQQRPSAPPPPPCTRPRWSAIPPSLHTHRVHWSSSATYFTSMTTA